MSLKGCPLVYCNKEFTRSTGYEYKDIYGRNCKFLQGPETETNAIRYIRDCLATGQDGITSIINYKLNGDKFINHISLRPLFDQDGFYRYVLSFQLEKINSELISKSTFQNLLRRLPHRLKYRSNRNVSAPSSRLASFNYASTYQELMKQEYIYLFSIFTLTKLQWLNNSSNVISWIIADALAREMFSLYCGIDSVSYQACFAYCCQWEDNRAMAEVGYIFMFAFAYDDVRTGMYALYMNLY